jgi:hypothetical protein
MSVLLMIGSEEVKEGKKLSEYDDCENSSVFSKVY